MKEEDEELTWKEINKARKEEVRDSLAWWLGVATRLGVRNRDVCAISGYSKQALSSFLRGRDSALSKKALDDLNETITSLLAPYLLAGDLWDAIGFPFVDKGSGLTGRHHGCKFDAKLLHDSLRQRLNGNRETVCLLTRALIWPKSFRRGLLVVHVGGDSDAKARFVPDVSLEKGRSDH